MIYIIFLQCCFISIGYSVSFQHFHTGGHYPCQGATREESVCPSEISDQALNCFGNAYGRTKRGYVSYPLKDKDHGYENTNEGSVYGLGEFDFPLKSYDDTNGRVKRQGCVFTQDAAHRLADNHALNAFDLPYQRARRGDSFYGLGRVNNIWGGVDPTNKLLGNRGSVCDFDRVHHPANNADQSYLNNAGEGSQTCFPNIPQEGGQTYLQRIAGEHGQNYFPEVPGQGSQTYLQRISGEGEQAYLPRISRGIQTCPRISRQGGQTCFPRIPGEGQSCYPRIPGEDGQTYIPGVAGGESGYALNLDDKPYQMIGGGGKFEAFDQTVKRAGDVNSWDGCNYAQDNINPGCQRTRGGEDVYNPKVDHALECIDQTYKCVKRRRVVYALNGDHHTLGGANHMYHGDAGESCDYVPNCEDQPCQGKEIYPLDREYNQLGCANYGCQARKMEQDPITWNKVGCHLNGVGYPFNGVGPDYQRLKREDVYPFDNAFEGVHHPCRRTGNSNRGCSMGALNNALDGGFPCGMVNHAQQAIKLCGIPALNHQMLNPLGGAHQFGRGGGVLGLNCINPPLAGFNPCGNECLGMGPVDALCGGQVY